MALKILMSTEATDEIIFHSFKMKKTLNLNKKRVFTSGKCLMGENSCLNSKKANNKNIFRANEYLLFDTLFFTLKQFMNIFIF